jgi:MFS family permease
VPFLLAVLSVQERASVPAQRLQVIPQLLEGLQFAWQHRKVRKLLMAVLVTAVFGLSYSTLLPALASSVLGTDARGYGLLLAASGLGAMVGSLGVAATGRRRGTVFRSQLLLGLSLAALALSKGLFLACLALVVAGLSVAAQLATTNGYIQTTSPDHLRARLISLYIWVFSGGAPLGGLLAGFLAERLGVPVAIGLGAGLCVAAALLQLLPARDVQSSR